MYCTTPTIVTLRDTPQRQWTRTRPPVDRASRMNLIWRWPVGLQGQSFFLWISEEVCAPVASSKVVAQLCIFPVTHLKVGDIDWDIGDNISIMLLCIYKLLFLQAASLPCTPAWWSEEDGSWRGGECQRHQLRGWFHDVGELESCEHLYGGDNLGQLNMRLFKLSLTDRQYWPVISERKRLSSTYGGWEWNNHGSWRSEEHITMFPCVVFSTSVGR